MSINISSKSIAVNQPVSKVNLSNKFENEIIVPDIKPDIMRLIMSACDVENVKCNVMPDKIEVVGDLIHQIIYASAEDDQLVRSLKSRQPFSTAIPVTNESGLLKPSISVAVTNLDNRPINPRKVHSNVELQITGSINQATEIEAISNIEAIEQVEQMKREMEYNRYLGDVSSDINVIDSILVPESNPAIWEVLYYNISKPELTINKSGGIAEVVGSANVVVVYLPENDEEGIQIIEQSVPIAGTIRLEELAEADVLSLESELENSRIEGIEDESGAIRRLSVEMEIDTEVQGYLREKAELVQDAFMPDNDLLLNDTEINQGQLLSENEGAFVIDQIILVEDPMPQVEKIIWGKANVKKSQIINVDNEWRISGVVEVKIIYLSEQGEIRGVSVDVPFMRGIEAPPEDFYDAVLESKVKNLSLTLMSPSEIKSLIEMVYTIKYYNSENIQIHTKCDVLETNPRVAKDEIVVYTVKPGDSLWKIAKEHLVNMDNILDMNGEPADESLQVGQRVFVMNS